MNMNNTKLEKWHAKYPLLKEVFKNHALRGLEYGTNSDGYLTVKGSKSVCFPFIEDGELEIGSALPMKVQDVPVGEFVTRKPDSKKLYRKNEGSYERASNKYWLEAWDHTGNDIGLKRDTIVWL